MGSEVSRWVHPRHLNRSITHLIAATSLNLWGWLLLLGLLRLLRLGGWLRLLLLATTLGCLLLEDTLLDKGLPPSLLAWVGG
jgi:hypothetical protein